MVRVHHVSNDDGKLQFVAQGLTPVWVDSWYYHLRFGEIHCGTNVLRKLPRGSSSWWTRVAATSP